MKMGLRTGWLFAALVLATTAGAQEATIRVALRLAGEGVAALDRGEAEAAVAKLTAAADLRPDVPRILSNLAAAQAAAGEGAAAIATLGRLAALGVALPVEKAEEFAALRGAKEFGAVTKTLAANDRPKGKGEMAFTLRDVTGLIEAIAWRAKTDEFYFGDVHARAVWRRSKDGKLGRVTPPSDEVFGVFGLAIDEARGTLWAATAAVPAMRGYTPEMAGAAALAEVDLKTGELRRTVPLRWDGEPPAPVLGAMALGAEGSLFAIDRSDRGAVWRLAPDGERLELAAQGGECVAPRGIAVGKSGVGVIADRANGLLRFDPATGEVQRLEPPPGTTLVGLEGVAAGAGNFVVVVQAGFAPVRILRVDLDASFAQVRAVRVLEAGHLTLAAPTQVCAGPAGEFYVIGNGGWPRFDGGSGEPTAPRSVPIFRISVN